MSQPFLVFLSAVSSEFQSVRSQLRADLHGGRGLEVRVQEDFRQEADTDTTLAKLEKYIRGCDAVVSLIGARSGALPAALEAAPFQHLLPDGMTEASHTQWEVIFARRHHRHLSFYIAGPDWVPDRDAPADDRPALQAAWRRHLFTNEPGCLNLDRKEGLNLPGDLRAEVLKEHWPDHRAAKPIHERFRSLGSLFKGRAGVMEQLRAGLSGGGRVAVTNKPAALHGLGGVGKTRLALEYGLAHQGEYTALLFVQGDTPSDLARNLANLAGVLNLPEAEAREDEVRLRAALNWLGAHPGWFLVLDNLDTPEALAAAEAHLAKLSGGHVVVTTRLADFSAHFLPLPLDVLAPEDAAAFLLERTEGRRRATAEDAALARAIGEDLGHLALALEQAGAYICKRRRSLAEYRADWAAKRAGVMAWHDPTVTGYPRSVAITWATSVAQLTPAGRRMLERLAFLAPEPVPEFLLDVPVPEVEEDLWAALEDVAAYSLVTRVSEPPGFRMHKLVQEVTRSSPGEAERARALQEALGWVDAGFEGNPQDVRSWPRLLPLAPHAAALTAAADAAGIADPTARLMGILGALLFARANHAEAEPLMRRALAIAEASYGPDHPNVATHLNNLAQQLKATNRLTKAEPMMRRALAIAKASYGPDHPDVAIRLNNLASLLFAKNRLGQAERLMRRALAIDEARYGPHDPKVAIRLNNIAQLLQATNRLGEAELLIRRALDIHETSAGTQHPNVAISLNNLAGVLQATNRLSEAELIMRRALTIDEASYGRDHPIVAIRLNNLAGLLHYANRLSEAEPLMRRHLEIFVAFTQATGHPHPHLQAGIRNYSGLLDAMGVPHPEVIARLNALLAPIGMSIGPPA